MPTFSVRWVLVSALAAALAVVGLLPERTDSACCYFSAKEKDILQPAQKAFITWDPDEKVFLISTFEGAAKVKTLRRDPKMSLLIDDPLNNLGVYVLVYGRGEIIGPGEAAVAPSLQLIKKYRYTDEASLQHWKEINEDGQRVIIRMTPDEWHWRDV